MDHADLETRLETLSHRVETLEALLFGTRQSTLSLRTLQTLYREAKRCLDEDVDPATAPEWARFVLKLDDLSLIRLGQSLDDLFPWKPLLLLLARLHEAAGDDDEDVLGPAIRHPVAVTQRLEQLQFEAFRDVLGGGPGNPPAVPESDAE